MKKETQLFKPAKSNNRIWNLAKTFIQTSFFWVIFLYIIPMGILKIESVLSLPSFSSKPIIGSILFLFFSMIGLYSGYTMSWIGKGTPLPLDCPNELVIKGPYRFVRNPMAVAGIGQGISVGIYLGSFVVMGYALSGAFLWHLFVRPIEEQDLEERFEQSYLDYKSSVRCWIPFFKS